MTFRLRAPNAQEVALTRLGQRQPMVKDERGVWSVTTGPLDPDIYTYTFFRGRRDVQRPFELDLDDVVSRQFKDWLKSKDVGSGDRGGLEKIYTECS